jgi:hypothetical protein
LFVNYQDIVISLKEELKYFEHNYCELLDFASQIMAKLEKNRSDDNIYKITNILNALIAPYKYFCIMYITSDVLLWSRRPLDNYTLHAKFAMFFDTMKRVYGILHERFPDVDSEPIAEQLLYDSSYGFYESNILHMLKTFDKCATTNISILLQKGIQGGRHEGLEKDTRRSSRIKKLCIGRRAVIF